MTIYQVVLKGLGTVLQRIKGRRRNRCEEQDLWKQINQLELSSIVGFVVILHSESLVYSTEKQG